MTVEIAVSATAGKVETDRAVVWTAILLTGGLLAARLLVIGRFDLFFDEAYYWLWSTQLAAGYFDHPPAVAFAIRIGTLLFGDTEFGVRFVGALSQVAIVALLFAIARTLTGSRRLAAWAAIFANLTTISAFAIFTVPDQAQLVFWLAAALGLSRIARGGAPAWWLFVGAMFGLSASAKYTAFILATGVLLWVVVAPSQRRWLATPWPYLGVAAGLAVLAPNLAWNASHGWPAFIVQAQQGNLAVAAPLSFLSYLALIPLIVSPPIFVLAALGAFAALRERTLRDPVIALLVLTPIPLAVYLGWHSLKDEIEFHWIGPLAYWTCLLAPLALLRLPSRLVSIARVSAFVFGLGVGLGFYLLLGQRIALPPSIDIAARFSGWRTFAANVEVLRTANNAAYVVSDRYYYPAYLAFYLADPPPTFHLHNPWIDGAFGTWSRWTDFPAADPALANAPAIFIGAWEGQTRDVAEIYFENVQYLGEVRRPTGGDRYAAEHAFLVSSPKPATAPLFNGWRE